MYKVYVFTLSGWARTVRESSQEDQKLKHTRGFQLEGTTGTKEECDKKVEEINHSLPQDAVQDLLLTI